MPLNNKNSKGSKTNCNEELRHSYVKATHSRRPPHQPPKKGNEEDGKKGTTANR